MKELTLGVDMKESFGSHEMGVNNFSPYYDDPIFIVNYGKSIFELYRKVFGVEEDTR